MGQVYVFWDFGMVCDSYINDGSVWVSLMVDQLKPLIKYP